MLCKIVARKLLTCIDFMHQMTNGRNGHAKYQLCIVWRQTQPKTKSVNDFAVVENTDITFLTLIPFMLLHHIHQSSCYNFQQALAQAILDGAGISLPGGIKGRLFGVFLRPFYQDEPFFHQDLWLNAMTSWAPATQSLSTVFLFPSTWLSKALGIGDCHGFLSPL